jgi:hypothetical protein
MKYFYIIALALLPLGSIAQSPVSDKVLMTNGEVKQGQVVSIDDESITFVHKNESLQYKLNKTDISKIEFASGRIEVYNPVQPSFQGSDGTNLSDHHNKVAILPFNYIRDGAQLKGDIMERKVQREFFSLLKGHVGALKILDPEGVNAALIKHNINGENIYQFTIPELANFLGVEYIVQGTLTINQSGTSSFGSTYGQAESKSWNKISGYSLSASSTTVQYHTIVDIVLYNDSGEAVRSQSKESVWPNDNAYDMTFRYLIKRMPIYSK